MIEDAERHSRTPRLSATSGKTICVRDDWFDPDRFNARCWQKLVTLGFFGNSNRSGMELGSHLKGKEEFEGSCVRQRKCASGTVSGGRASRGAWIQEAAVLVSSCVAGF